MITLTYSRPAKSSDKAEDLPLLGTFFLNLLPFRFNLKFFRFFRTLLVIANNIHRHIEVLLFSTSFVISVLFGDVKTEKIGSFCVTGRYNIAIFSEHKNLPRFFAKRRKIFCLYFIKCWKVCYRDFPFGKALISWEAKRPETATLSFTTRNSVQKD